MAEPRTDRPAIDPTVNLYEVDLEEASGKAYRKGVELAISETGLPRRQFPADCRYTLVEIGNDRFYPGEDSDRLSGERSF